MEQRKSRAFLWLSTLLLLSLPSRSFALDGMWVLHNEFKQSIVEGTLSGISSDEISILGCFMFDPEKLKQPIIPSKVYLFDLNLNKQVSYSATSIDESDKGVVLIGIKSLNNLLIPLFIAKIDNRTYRYVYGIGMDMEKGVLLTAKDLKMYFIYTGKMVKATK